MSTSKDLTRWNRAGLSRFNYVDGDAARYLEILRLQMFKKFHNPQTKKCEWLNPVEEVPANEMVHETETLLQRQERLSLTQERILETYQQDRQGWAWEISRTFARACHILTEHTNAYANEGYLGTATQWEHVRRLVDMLDYHPAPPASATTQLVLHAKKNMAGIIARGFQVKNSPVDGSKKVIFETLEDLYIDSALNELRPKGWNKSPEPAVVLPTGTGQIPAEQLYSSIALKPAINIQGVGAISAVKLNALSTTGIFKIKDFCALDPDNTSLDISSTWLWEWKAKANLLIGFSNKGNWSAISEWSLIQIAETSADALADVSGNPLEMAAALKLDIEIIQICLDQEIYRLARFKDLIAPAPVVQGVVVTTWQAEKKPKVLSGDVAMIYREYRNSIANQIIDEAEAATISKVEEHTDIIHLTPGPVQQNWFHWTKGEARLKVSPRLEKKCWLNGFSVIRTVKPHGLSADAFVSWKQNNQWKFAKVIEADEMNLRLDSAGNLPGKDTLLYEAHPLESNIMATTLEAIGLVKGAEPDVEEVSFAEDAAPIFTMKDLSTTSIPLPPLMPPGGLSFGSFLFPTPMLPMDLVKVAVDLLLSLGVMVIPSTGEVVFKSLSPGKLPTVDNLFAMLTDKVNWRSDLTTVAAQKAALAVMLQTPAGAPIVLFQKILDNLQEKGPLIAVKKNPAIKAVVASLQPLYVIEGGAGKMQSGDWLVGQFTDGLRALKIRAINTMIDNDKSEKFSLSFDNLSGTVGELQKIYGDFRGELIAKGATVNNSPLLNDAIELDAVPEKLAIGRHVLLTAAGKESVQAQIASIDGNIIKTKPSPAGFNKGNLVIYGNTVLASHGVSKPAKILGSGDATKSNQEFLLDIAGLSFIPDATKSSGVAAAIEVEVAGRVWEQVSTLRDSTSGDHHYIIRMTEDAYVKIIFGDGKYGRRLPSGKNNVRVRYRVGTGLSGNVPPHSLEKPVNPHPLIETVLQYQSAAGGGDMEDVTSLRENAPSTLLALKRAVSLQDFSHLATSQSSVWQAKAFRKIQHGGRVENVQIVIVPAGGVQTPLLNESIRAFLQKHALPGVQVTVTDYIKKHFDISVKIRVITDEFVSENVERAVATALLENFKLRNRKLGEHLYLSEIYRVVEGVQGVENSVCVLDNDASLQLIKSENESTVIYLDIDAESNPSTILISTEEYLP